tara:strand:- start:1515 stop:3017 length:1503 start_codon:yes stop_codon:yes gene_type:complete
MKKSKNPITNVEYTIPDNLDDINGINNFVSKNKNKKIIAVQGLGFVGSVMSIVCANSKSKDYAVIGIDLPNESNFWKIASINEGVFPIVAEDKKIEVFFKKTKKNGNFYATYDPYAYSLADIIIVDINLDVEKKLGNDSLLEDFKVNMNPFKSAIKSIGKNCQKNSLILVETTVPPGTCEKVVKPIINEELKKRNLDYRQIKIAHSYERVMPGPNYIDSILNFPRVFSGIDKKSAIAAKVFLKTIINTDEYPLTELHNTNSTEMAKVLENSYRAMNIAFIVEWTRFAEEANVNLFEVIDSIKVRSTHSNMMLPGIGVGGYCLTKDPLLASWSREKIFSSSKLNQSEEAVIINDQMPRYAFEFFKLNFHESLKNKIVLFLGVSYRGDIGDTRYTPVEKMYDFFKNEGAQILLNDPFVSFWDEKNLKVETSLKKSLQKKFDIIVLCTNHSVYKSKKLTRELNKIDRKLYLYDTLGALTKNQIDDLKNNVKTLVLGRGDLIEK